MNGIGWKVVIPGSALAAICYIYLLLDPSVFPTDAQDASGGLDLVLSAFGSAIPKAQTYASYFRENGSVAFAAQLVRVYGFCALAFLLAAMGYLCVRLPLILNSSGPAASDPISKEQRAHIVQVERVGAAAAILVAYANLFGFGLSSRSSYFAESTSGANVLGNPVVSFPVLFMILLYLLESRIYRRRTGALLAPEGD